MRHNVGDQGISRHGSEQALILFTTHMRRWWSLMRFKTIVRIALFNLLAFLSTAMRVAALFANEIVRRQINCDTGRLNWQNVPAPLILI